MEKFNHSAYTNYFKKLAENYKPVALQFCRHDIEDFLEQSVSNLKEDWVLVLESVEFDTIEPRSDNPNKVRQCAFMILYKVSRKDDFESRDNKLDGAEQIGDDIFRRIRRDWRKRENGIVHMSMNTFKGQKVGLGVLHSDYEGMRFSLELTNPLLLKEVDGTTWKDL